MTKTLMSEQSKMDALLIGIDAGCLPVLERMFEEDRLPNLEALCTDGVSAPLTSQMPPWTPSAWPSMYTGVNPGKHGVYGFLGYDGYDFHVVTGSDVDAHRLWTILDDHDLSSVVVNVPVTHPPDEIDGAILPGFMGPEDPQCHPEGLLDDVREALGEYRIYPYYARGDDSLSDAEKMDEYERLIRMRGEAFRYLAGRFEPDFGFVQFQKTDTVFHEFDGAPEKVRRVYEATDDEIGSILDAHDPAHVFVASDHGMGQYEKQEFRVNVHLRDRGYVETTRGGKGMPTWNVMREDLREGEEARTWNPGVAEKAMARAANVGVTTRRVGKLLDRLGLKELARRYAPSGVVRTGNEQVDFPASKAYMRARTELGVRINLEGRDPQGVVSPDEYERVRAELIDALEDATAPDGEPVFQEVVPREEYFHGPHTEAAADVVTVPNDFQHLLSAQLSDDTFGPSTEPWNHKLEGIVAAWGEEIDTDVDLDDAHLFDVAPTVLAALGVPASEYMDGDVLPVTTPVGTVSRSEFESGESEAVGSDVEDRLADLGYME